MNSIEYINDSRIRFQIIDVSCLFSPAWSRVVLCGRRPCSFSPVASEFINVQNLHVTDMSFFRSRRSAVALLYVGLVTLGTVVDSYSKVIRPMAYHTLSPRQCPQKTVHDNWRELAYRNLGKESPRKNVPCPGIPVISPDNKIPEIEDVGGGGGWQIYRYWY